MELAKCGFLIDLSLLMWN